MIRLIQRNLIIPRGDTGSFTIPARAAASGSDVAVFTVFSPLTRKKVFQKIVNVSSETIQIEFTHNDTVNLVPGKYVWDIKYYKNPQYAEDELINGDEIDSYYAGYTLPFCEIRETGDNLLVSPDAARGTLTSEELDIITAALASLKDAVDKTADNVEHYPQIREDEWYVWSAEANDYVATGVSANGIAGNGIESAVLNNDYTLTLNFTDGTSYTTPSIRGTVGATPQFSIGTVQEGASAAATITGTAEAPVLNLTLPNADVPTKISELENDENYAIDANYVHTDNNYTTEEKTKLSGIENGAEVNVNADWNATSGDAQILNKPTKVSDFTNDAGYLTSFTETDPTVPAWAKAAQKPSYTAAEVGAPTVAEMNTAIREAIGQINSFDIAIVQALPTQDISTHTIYLVPKMGETNDVYDEYIYIDSKWEMVGNTQIDLSDYALKSELPTKVSELSNDSGYLTSYTETDPTVPQWAKTATKPSYTAAEVGALPSNTHIPSTTAELENDAGFITAEEVPDAPVRDVQVNGTSILSNGVANIPYASENTTYGIVKAGEGLYAVDGQLNTSRATSYYIKNGTDYYRPIVPNLQHEAAFYGLAKAAGADMASSSNPVGTYTDEAKSAIRSMLSAISNTDYATSTVGGTVKVNSTYGMSVESNGNIVIYSAGEGTIKSGSNWYQPIVPVRQHYSVFYGLAKAAGDTTQPSSSNSVGTYTSAAKTAIQHMLDVPSVAEAGAVVTENISGTTPTINAIEGHRYVCGEVTSINFTPSTNGLCELMFTSGSTVAVLTLPSTVKMPEWFEIEAERVYDIIITDGVYGAVTSWAM